MREHITIKDVAKKLSISVSTVSKAFNEHYYDISDDTRKLILKTADEMGYRPNPIARILQRGRTCNIGIIVPDFLDSFFPEVVFNIQKTLLKEGYQLMIMPSNEHFETELENLKTLENNMVDGIIVSLSKETHNVDYINKIISRGMPVVLFNRVSAAVQAPKVVFDDYKWAHFATEHLIRQGYRNIYHLALPYQLAISQQRIDGFKKALEKHHIPVSEKQIIETGISLNDGKETITQLLDEGHTPDAIFAAGGDKVAIGAMKVLLERGYKIPEEVGVMGFTETTLADVIEPGLTSVKQPTDEIGQTVVDLLLAHIKKDNDVRNETYVIDGTLNIRASSRRHAHLH